MDELFLSQLELYGKVLEENLYSTGLLNKDIFVFFAHKKKYSCSFIKLRCHVDYYKYVLTTFLSLEHVSYIAVYAGSESSQVSSKIS